MIVRNVWKTNDDEFDLKIDGDMRETIKKELVKRAMNALSKSFDDDEVYIFEALECLKSWENLMRPSISFSLRTKEEEPVSEAL